MNLFTRIVLLTVFVAGVFFLTDRRILPFDDFDKHARAQGLSRAEYLRSLELFGKAREGLLTKAEWPELKTMAASSNAYLRETAEAAFIGVARFGPCRREALARLGPRLSDLHIAYAADAPGWRNRTDKALRSGNARLIKTANWILAAEEKRKAGDPRYARF